MNYREGSVRRTPLGDASHRSKDDILSKSPGIQNRGEL